MPVYSLATATSFTHFSNSFSQMSKLPISPSQILLAAALLAAPLAHAQEGGKMTDDKMTKSGKMSHDKMAKGSKMSHDKMSHGKMAKGDKMSQDKMAKGDKMAN